MSNIFFSIFGTGLLIKVYTANNPLSQAAKEYTSKLSFKKNLFTLKELGDKTYSTYLDYEPEELISVYNIDKSTRLEIRSLDKKYKLFFKEIMRKDLLFISEFIGENYFLNLNNDSLFIIEEVLGNFGNANVFYGEFKPKHLKINTLKLDEIEYVFQIRYDTECIKFSNDDLRTRGIDVYMSHFK